MITTLVLKTVLNHLDGGGYGVLRGAVRRARRVGWDDGTCLGVRLTSNAMTLSDQVLAFRIVRRTYVCVSALALRNRRGVFRRSGWVGVCSVGTAGGGVCVARSVLMEPGRWFTLRTSPALTEQVEARIARLQCAVHELELRFAGVRVQAASEGGEVVVLVDANGRLVGLDLAPGLTGRITCADFGTPYQ